MCQENGKSFIGAIVREVEKRISLDPRIGKIHLGCLPPRIEAIKEKDAFFAVATLISFLGQYKGVCVSEEIFEYHFNPATAADFLIQVTVSLVENIGILNKPRVTDLGKAKVYLFFLSAVLALFLDFLLSRHHFEQSFRENMERAEKYAFGILLARSEPNEKSTLH